MNDERRQAARVRVSLEARWEGIAGRYTARVSDLSLHGCFFETIGSAALGDMIDFDVRLPTGRWLSLQGIVAFIDQNIGFGVSFTNLHSETRRYITRLVEYYASDPM
jgi:hypothetical protein